MIIGFIVVLMLGLLGSSKAHAYTKIGAGYIIEQPSRYDFVYQDGSTSHTDADYKDYSVHVEHGSVIGDVYFGAYGTYSTGRYHDPYKVELFADYDWINTSWHIKTGIGYKVRYQKRFDVDGKTIVIDDIRDKLSARIGISREFGDIEIGLWHDSQWFKGFPFDDNWEYRKTVLNVSWGF